MKLYTAKVEINVVFVSDYDPDDELEASSLESEALTYIAERANLEINEEVYIETVNSAADLPEYWDLLSGPHGLDDEGDKRSIGDILSLKDNTCENKIVTVDGKKYELKPVE